MSCSNSFKRTQLSFLVAIEKKITILTIGTRGDIHPFVALGNGLREAGFEVKMATHEEFKPLVNSYGLDFAPVIGSVASSLRTDRIKESIDKGGKNREFFNSIIQEATHHFEEALLNFKDACEGAEIIITSPFSLHIANYLTDHFKVPLIFCSVNPAGPTTEFHHVLSDPPKGPKAARSAYNKTTHKIFTEIVWRYIKAELKPTWNNVMPNKLKFPTLDPLAAAFKKKLPLILYAYSPAVLPKPKDWSILQHVTGYWWLPTDEEYVPPSPLKEFVESGEKQLYIGFGSMTNPKDNMLATIFMPAVKALGQKAVVLDDGSDLSEFKDDKDIFLIKRADFNWLFPRMKAVVHHGGVGTTGIGLRTGTPTLTVTFIPDQRFWGWRLSEMGAMPKPIPRKGITYEIFHDKLKELINNPSYKNITEELSFQINKENGVKNAVELVQQYLVIIKEHFAKEKVSS